MSNSMAKRSPSPGQASTLSSPGLHLQPPPDVPGEQERLAILQDIMGDAHDDVAGLPSAIRQLVHREYNRHVVPHIRRHWPTSLDGDDAEVGVKLRFLACDLYASAPYTVLLSSKTRPWPFRVGSGIADVLPLPRPVLVGGAKFAVSVFGALSTNARHRRIVLIGAFIATIDHAFDHCMSDVAPAERGQRIRALLDGKWLPDDDDGAPFRLTRALQLAMEDGLPEAERDAFDQAMERVKEWAASEVKGMTGVPDPLGLCHRLAGVEGTIDGLFFPVHSHADERHRQWMYDVSWFVQMMDDWLDLEKDLQDVRTTPVITGKWTRDDLDEAWSRTVRGLEDLTRQSGVHSERYISMVKDAYIYMMKDVMNAMAHGIAA